MVGGGREINWGRGMGVHQSGWEFTEKKDQMGIKSNVGGDQLKICYAGYSLHNFSIIVTDRQVLAYNPCCYVRDIRISGIYHAESCWN